MSRRVERFLLWGLLAAVLLAVAVVAVLGPSWRAAPGAAAEPVPVLGEVPPFALTSHLGAPVDRESLAGRPWIASFVFTRCAISCPRMISEARRLASRLDPAVARLVLVTVDPLNDTPPVLAEYLRAHAAPADWLFLTGAPETVRELVVGGFKLAVGEAPAGSPNAAAEPLMHSTRFVLVDGEGRIRGYYDALDAEAMSRLVADTARVAAGV